jgi:serine/threonine protein kinase
MGLLSGRRLGPYEIVSLIGAGGMGEVYKARDTRLDRAVALKVLSGSVVRPDARLRFEREARAISRLSHPRICALYDVGRDDEIDYLVMEFLDGETLSARLLRGPLPLEHVLRYAIEIAEGIDAAHQQGIVHRDLKPSNIMLTRAGAKLLDFGVAKLLDPALAGPATTTAFAPLTPAYASPEQILGQPISTACDVYGLGVVLYELLTGRLPYDTPSGQPMEVLKAVVEQEPRKTDLDGDLDDILMMALRKEPQRRYASVEAFS